MVKRYLFPPTVIFVLFAALYVSLALFNDNTLLFRPVWDIDHYRTIAERGYEIYPCDPAIHYPLGDLCGNVGWFPAWPFVLKILSLGQVNIGLKVLPYVFAWLGFILMFTVLVDMAGRMAAWVGTIALAATPSAFYFLTGFPYSFILFLFGLYLYYLYRPQAPGRSYILPLAALLFSLSYPSAFLAAVIPLFIIIRRFRSGDPATRSREILRESAFHLLPFILGPLLLSLYFSFKFDDFLMIVHFQEKYHRSWGFPLTVIWDSLLQFPALYVENASVLFYGLALMVFVPYRMKSELVAFYLVLFFFSPATGSITSVYRHYLLLFPAAMIIGTSARPLWLKIVYILLGLALALGRFFPIFLGGRLI